MQAENETGFVRSSENHQLRQIKFSHDDKYTLLRFIWILYTVAKLSKRKFSLRQLRRGGGGRD
jgi:hypothetical protein